MFPDDEQVEIAKQQDHKADTSSSEEDSGVDDIDHENDVETTKPCSKKRQRKGHAKGKK